MLLEPYNTIVLTLLYRTAEWHAFAKLRLHTESTLQHLESLTTELGNLMREFRDSTESDFEIVELPKEKGKRQRSGKGKKTSGKKAKSLNLFTYKWHALGDYVRTIRLFGGTDNYSTQVVRLLFTLTVQCIYYDTRLAGRTFAQDC